MVKDIELKKFLEKTKSNDLNSHVILYSRGEEENVAARIVGFSESIFEKRRNILLEGMESGEKREILEVYNLALDIDEQFNEEKANHLYPLPVVNVSDIELQNALDFATENHKGQFRKDGQPYIVHPIRVAELLNKYYKGDNKRFLMMCAYLHDVVEDSLVTFEDIEERFGKKVESVISEVTNDKDTTKYYGKEYYLQIKMYYMSYLALTLKLCDRLDNISDLKAANEAFKDKVISQTIGILKYIIDRRILDPCHSKVIGEIIDTILLEDISNEQRVRLIDMKATMESKALMDALMLKLTK